MDAALERSIRACPPNELFELLVPGRRCDRAPGVTTAFYVSSTECPHCESFSRSAAKSRFERANGIDVVLPLSTDTKDGHRLATSQGVRRMPAYVVFRVATRSGDILYPTA